MSVIRRGEGRLGGEFQMIDDFTEFVDVLEAPVNRGKTDVSDVVKTREFRHDAFSDESRGNFALTSPEQFLFDSRNGCLDPLDVDRSFFQGSQHAGSKFVFAERFPVSVALDDAGEGEFNRFKCREPLTAFCAFTPATNLIPLLGESGIDDSGVIRAAKRTSHRKYRD